MVVRMVLFFFSEGLRCIQSVGEWLEGLDLLQYENIFLVNGFDDMRFMVRAKVTPGDLAFKICYGLSALICH